MQNPTLSHKSKLQLRKQKYESVNPSTIINTDSLFDHCKLQSQTYHFGGVHHYNNHDDYDDQHREMKGKNIRIQERLCNGVQGIQIDNLNQRRKLNVKKSLKMNINNKNKTRAVSARDANPLALTNFIGFNRTLSAKKQSKISNSAISTIMPQFEQFRPNISCNLQQNRKSPSLGNSARYMSIDLEREQKKYNSSSMQANNENKIYYKNSSFAHNNNNTHNTNINTTKNTRNSITISPWIKVDQSIVNKQVNVFDFYRKQMVRRKQQKMQRNMYDLNNSPIVIKSFIEQGQKKMDSQTVRKIQDMYKQWKNSSRMIVSGRSLSGTKRQSNKRIQKNPLRKKQFSKINFKNIMQQQQIKGWQGDKNAQIYQGQFL